MTLWSGRFAEPPSDVLWRYTVDHSDRRLLVDDVTGSLAHVAMLGEAGILPDEDTAAITDGLRRIRGRGRRVVSSALSTATKTSTAQWSGVSSSWWERSAGSSTPADHATIRWLSISASTCAAPPRPVPISLLPLP